MTVDEGFAHRIKLAHRQSTHADLNQTEIARMLGVTNAAVSNWFNGTRTPHKKLTALARLLNVSSDWLRTGREPMRPLPPTAITALAMDFTTLSSEESNIVMFLINLKHRQGWGLEQFKAMAQKFSEYATQ